MRSVRTPSSQRHRSSTLTCAQLLSKWRPPLARDGTDIVRSLFQMKLKVILKCMESEETTQDELEVYTLKCNITGDINHLQEGIRLGLVEDREKRSDTLQRTAAWRGDARLSELPAYLTIQVVRFFYKVQAQQKAKIMRKVQTDLLQLTDDWRSERRADAHGPRMIKCSSSCLPRPCVVGCRSVLGVHLCLHGSHRADLGTCG